MHMHTPISAAMIAVAFAVSPLSVLATDVQNLDQVGHVLNVTSGDETVSLQLEALSEREGVCDGCILALEDGQSLLAGSEDLISIIDGKLVAEH